MRCRECNIDLPDNYTACPLCSSEIFDDELKIKGIRTAEYPKAQPEAYKRNPFPIFLLIWLLPSLAAFVLYKLGIIELTVTASVFCVIPCMWTLFFRPVMIKQLYAGNFIVMNLFPFSMSCMIFSKLRSNSFGTGFETYIPLCALAVFLALTVYIFVKPEKNKRAASYPVLMVPIALIATVFFAVTSKNIPYLWMGVLLLNVFILAFLFATKPYEVKEELKAKFSVQ